MRAEDILNQTDPQELRNLIHKLQRLVEGNSRPAMTAVINENPTQYPPLTPSTGGLAWFNVKAYGAIGNGIANDTTAINNTIAALNAAGRGVLYFPAGAYLVSSALTVITAAAYVMGDGTSSIDKTIYGTKILCSSATAALFEVSSLYASFYNLTLVNTAGSTPSAGAGVKVSGSDGNQRVDFLGVRFHRFYIGVDIAAAEDWTVDGCAFYNPILYGLRCTSVTTNVTGWKIVNSIFYGFSNYPTAAVYLDEAASLGIVSNCYISFFVSGIVAVSGIANFGKLICNNNTVSNMTTGHGIDIDGCFAFFVVDGNVFDLSNITGNDTGSCVSIANISNGAIVISDNVLSGGTTPPAIVLNTITGSGRIVGNVNSTFSELATLTSAPGVEVIDSLSGLPYVGLTGDESVAGVKTFTDVMNIVTDSPTESALYVESDGNQVTGDFEQYTVDDDVTRPALFIYRAGSGAGDFTAPFLWGTITEGGAGVSTGELIKIEDDSGDLFVVDRNGSPNIPTGQTYNIDGLPHTHSEGGGQYRQFVTVSDGMGGWEFVSSGGAPVFVLQDLE